MVAIANHVGSCPKCGGGLSLEVEQPERFACVYCGWREYGNFSLQTSGEGSVLRLRYLGASSRLMRFPPLLVVMGAGAGRAARSRLELRIACPLCRVEGVLRVMKRWREAPERWRCDVGHEVRLHRVGREEIVGWS